MVKKKIAKNISIKKTINCGPGMKCGSGSAVYCLGFIGAVVYFISQSTSFGMGILGFLKALVWPAFLVYELLKFLGI